MHRCIVVLFLLVGFTGSSASAQTAGMLSFQGLIKDSGGNPITGTVDLEFRIFDAETLGNLVDMNGDGVVENVIGQDVKQVLGVTATDGILATKFGPVSPVAFDGTGRWLEVSVGGSPLSRIEMATAPAASEQVNIPATGTPAITIDDATGNVGIGTNAPTEPLSVAGIIESIAGGFKFPDGTMQSSAAMGVTVGTVARNPLQIALLRWYEANESGLIFSVGNSPRGVAFDGANIWVANSNSNSVTKLRAADGALLGTFSVGNSPYRIAFDGANIWVANQGSNNVTKLRAADGVLLGTFGVGSAPRGVAFDGANIWVTNAGSNTVTKLRASDGVVLFSVPVSGTLPESVAFDGANIWVVNSGSNTVTKLRNDPVATRLGTFSVGALPQGVVFDGANIWVTNSASSSVTKLRASDGALLGTFSAGAHPFGVAFDGVNIWVTNQSTSSVTKLRASDGALLGTFSVGTAPLGIAFDGANIWVTNAASNTVSKL